MNMEAQLLSHTRIPDGWGFSSLPSLLVQGSVVQYLTQTFYLTESNYRLEMLSLTCTLVQMESPRQHLLPELSTKKTKKKDIFLKSWHTGCVTGLK